MDDAPQKSDDLKLQLMYFRQLNYAMQQHGISVIQKLVLQSSTPREELDLEISTTPAFTPVLRRPLASLEAGSSLEMEELTLDWDAQKLADLSEPQLIHLQIKLSHQDEVLKEQRFDLELMPPDAWLGSAILPEMLCAFVTPNAPEIPLVLQRAAALLAEWSGDASFTAYDCRSEDGVRQQMAAVFQAISELGIVYSQPLSQSQSLGQRVRMADKLMAQRLGTCLDMAVFYASCVEAIGLHPIIVLIEGHAFVGCWLIEDVLSDPVNDDVTVLRKRAAAGVNEMCFLEATAMSAGRDCYSFEQAIRLAQPHLANDAAFELAIDVRRCRLSRIRPLNSRGGVIEVGSAFEGLAVDSTPESIAPRKVMDLPESQLLCKQSVWERKLLDLSLRNNLLNVRRTRSLIPLMSANLHLLEDALADGKDFMLLPHPSDWRPSEDPTASFRAITKDEAVSELITHELSSGRLHCFETEAEAQRSFTHLYRSARLAMEENGTNTLYLALGLLRWYESSVSQRPRFAPILLLPVEMKRRRGVSSAYTIRSSEEEIMVNITLLEMLKQDFAMDLSPITNLPRDEHGVDIPLIFSTLRDLLKNQARWDIEEQALLGTFSFSKFIMWNDIHNNADLLRSHPLVDSLISSQVRWEAPAESCVNLDDDLRPSELLLPVPADSYQMEATYRAAIAGESFVLHGPPGSGKSQTITNIVANALYRGKRVLFVAEKMAALSVVHKRLSQIGLGPFCLELHSNKSTKAAVLNQLEEAAQYQQGQSATDFEGEAQRLYALRQELREHVDALHEQLPLGLSLYECLYALEQLPPAPMKGYSPAKGLASSMSADAWLNARESCERLQSIAKVCDGLAQHPLRGVTVQDFSPELKEQAEQELADLLPCYDALKEAGQQFIKALDLGIPMPQEAAKLQLLDQMAQLLAGGADLTAPLLLADDGEELARKAEELCRHGEAYDELHARLTQRLHAGVLDWDAKLMLDKWQAAQDQWFLPYFLTCWGLTRKLRSQLLPQQELKSEEVPHLLADIITAQRERQALTELKAWQEAYVGKFDRDWAAIRRAIRALQELNRLLLQVVGGIAPAKAARKALAEHYSMGKAAFLQLHVDVLQAFSRAHEQLSRQEQSLQGLLHMAPDERELDLRRARAEELHQQMGRLRDWCNWKSTSSKIAEQQPELADFIHYAEHEAFAPAQLAAEYERGIYRAICKEQMQRHPIFSQFNGLIFEERLARYRELVALNQELAKLELCANLGAKIPNFAREASQNSELGILQRCIRSRGRGMSIRQLFDKLPELMPRLKPCMLMSPMSVAQYLDAGNPPFDLVIFDEASQLPTCEAVGTIARGRSIIVVGDPRQMPPTSFFASNSVDEEHLELEDLESILEDCLGLSMPSRHLRWHYRSKHESLIAFSNAQYYENKLLTFPSPDDLCSKISLIPVEGYYDKGKSRCNVAEAEALVQEALRHLADPERSKRSLGIISFSQVQQSLIEDLLMQALSKADKAHLEQLALGGEEPIFVKNLENVQGDERDVIYFSVGYGPDEQGRVSHNFGPLNREGGERRLNVAVSRARYEMKIFATLSPDQIDLSRSKAKGVAGLRAFLEFAQEGKQALLQKSSCAHVPKASIIELIAQELEQRGFEVKSHVGSSAYRIDLAVVHPEKPEDYLAAIICDGASYQAAPTLRDREITRVGVLRMLGWNVLRLWAIDWWMDRQQVIERLVAALHELKTHQQEEEPIVIDLQAELSEVKEEAGRRYQYQQQEIAPMDSGDEDPLQGRFAAPMKEQIRSILATESPVTKEYLTRRIMEAWGLKVLTKRVQSHFDALFSSMKLHQTGRAEQATLWSCEQEAQVWGIYRVGGGREAKNIPREELCLAAYEILQQQMAMPREDLQAELIELFELGRKTKALRSIVDGGIATALAMGYIIEEEGRCKLA